MKITTNYHTHTYLCKHAEGTIEEYVQKAVNLGYTDIGISDHCPLTDDLVKMIYSRRMTMDQYYNDYLPALEACKNKFKGIINVHSAVEVEYFDEMKDFYPELSKTHDYLVLGQHYFKYQDKYISVYSQLSPKMLEIYCDTVIEALNTGYFKILAHPDFFCWGYPFWDEICVEISKKIIDAAIKNNVILEINANGIRNCEKNHRYITVESKEDSKKEIHCYAYPNLEFFKLCAETSVLVMVNDDAHSPNNICDEDTIRAYEFAESLGIKLVNKL